VQCLGYLLFDQKLLISTTQRGNSKGDGHWDDAKDVFKNKLGFTIVR